MKKLFKKLPVIQKVAVWILILSGGDLLADTSFSDLKDLPKIPPAEVGEVLEAFGARQRIDGKISFKSRTPSGHRAVKTNLLFLYGVGPDFRAKMYEQSSCGARDYQLIHVKTKTEGETHGVIYNCKNECLAMREFMQNGKLKGVSRPISLPESFCDGLWSGMAKVVDKNGL